jgi:hypothetical protein
MKNIYFFRLFVFWILPIFGSAQVGIGTDNPDPSALLDIVSNSEGLLTPRLTTLERDAILSPETGLLIYNTTTSYFNYFDLEWKEYSDYLDYFNSNSIINVATNSKSDVVIPGMTIAPILAGTYEVTFNCSYTNLSIESTVVSEVSVSQKAKLDLDFLINQLDILAVTNSIHDPVFGNGETISPGVYLIQGAASIAGNLTLDGGGNSDSIFVIKTNGALAAGAETKVFLTNGAQARNIFWLVYGAPSFGTNSIMKGTVIAASTGAIAFNIGGNLEGRLLTISGAITFNLGIATLPLGTSPFELGSLSNIVLFTASGAITNAGFSTLTGNIGTNLGAISGFESAIVNGDFFTSIEYNSFKIISSNTNKVLVSFSIYQNDILIPSSTKILTSDEDVGNANLHAILTLEANQLISIRWKTDTDEIGIISGTITLIKV